MFRPLIIFLLVVTAGCASVRKHVVSGVAHALLPTSEFHIADTVKTNLTTNLIKDMPPAGTIDSKEALHHARDWSVFLGWGISVLLALSALILFWMEHYFTAGCFMLAAFIMPVIAVLFAIYYAWIVGASIILFAAVIFIHYKVVIQKAVSPQLKRRGRS